MDYISILWDDYDDETGNVQHVAEHDLTCDDVETVLKNPVSKGKSHSSDEPAAFGYTDDGRFIIVVYEQIDEDTIYPITAYEIDEP